MEKTTVMIYGEPLVVEYDEPTTNYRTNLRCSYCGDLGANAVSVHVHRVVGRSGVIGPTSRLHIIAKFLLERVFGHGTAFCRRCQRRHLAYIKRTAKAEGIPLPHST